MQIHEILNHCHLLKIEAHHHKFPWAPDHKVRLTYITPAGDKVEVERHGSDPLDVWNEAWAAINDLAGYGFRLAPQIEHKPDDRPLTEVIDDEIPF